MVKYQGHRSWNAWNVALWIHNNEPLYRAAVDLCQRHGVRNAATMLAIHLEGQKTPDGARYNLTCVREALKGILD